MSNGRPTVITEAVVSILSSSFRDGFSVREACWLSGISHEAYYSKLRKDSTFADIMARAQADITMNARKVVAKAIHSGDIGSAKWWLEHKVRSEFGKTALEQESQREAIGLTKDQLTTKKLISSLEHFICQRYRGVLFNQREQRENTHQNQKRSYSGREDSLIIMPNSQLADYIELEIYATGKDKADVREWVAERHTLLSDNQLDYKEYPII